MTNKEYREHEGISRSQLQEIQKTPFHFHYMMENPKEETESLLFGRASHKYILEKDDFFNEYAVAPKVDRRTLKGKEEWAEFCEASEGKSVITQEQFETILEMDKSIDKHPIARQLLTGDVEQSFFWTDTETGEAVKCRPDCMTEYDGKSFIVDYKTTTSCADGDFERSCRKYGYQLQAGMYREGVFQNTLEEYGFIFVAQEKTAPYAVNVYVCSKEYIDRGYDIYRKLLGTYHWCKENDSWYGYEGALNEVTELLEED